MGKLLRSMLGLNVYGLSYSTSLKFQVTVRFWMNSLRVHVYQTS